MPLRSVLFRLTFLALSMLGPAARPASTGKIGANARPQAILFMLRTPTTAEIKTRSTHAKYEPAVGCYLGGYIEFDRSLRRMVIDYDRVQRRDPAQFEERVGKPHAMYFFYVGYGRPAPLGWIRWLADHGKFVHIALEPNDGLDRVNDDLYLRRLADDLGRTRARIFLRFGSEMNGAWTNYHDPRKFREKFRLVHSVMRKRAPNVALVWCPYAMPIRNIPEYYPGDDATDWVGVNMYSVIYHDNNRNAPCEHEHPNDLLSTVYERYAARKPMMICEFGATHYSDCDRRSRPDFAMLKIATLYSALPRIFPRVKAINYFDLSTDSVHNDYAVTDDPNVLSVYRGATASHYFLSSPPNGTAAAGLIPLPVRKGELLRGNVRLSCFARGPSDRVSVRYKLDGRMIHEAFQPNDWSWDWNAGTVAPGRHMLAIDVFDARGRQVAAQALSVKTAR